MGGGGGSSSFGPGDLDALLKKAREQLDRAMEGRRNVFLSFAAEDLDDVNLLRGQSKNERSDLEFNDWSVKEPYDSKRADYIKQKISERIAQSSATVVYLSAHSASSQWVNWEVEESLRQKKTVIGVYKGTNSPGNLPASVVKNEIKVVPWSELSKEL